MKKRSQANRSKKRKERSAEFALLPIREFVTFPGTVLPVFINRNINLTAVEHALAHGNKIILTLQRGVREEKPSQKNLCRFGVLAQIISTVRLSNGELKIRLQINERVRISSYSSFTPFVRAQVSIIEEAKNVQLTAKQEELITEVKSKFAALGQYDENIEEHVFVTQDTYAPGTLADLIAASLPLDVVDAQKLLEELDTTERLRKVDRLLNSHLDLVSVKERISSRVQEEMSRSEHEHVLREQLRQIQAELGEGGDEAEDDLGDLRDQLKKLRMPAHAKSEAQKQLRRLQQLHPDTSEAALARTYLDWIVDLPWSKRSKDRVDMTRVKAILDTDHFGLERTKERILDFLGVRKLKKDLRGPILLLVGPPGVGKTSLGRSIAQALGRQFVRVSVGGLRDEAELRGHRRTYVGALPGRIIQGLKSAGTKNPVFILDELDKVGSDFRGDPASVLLEVLDPEQNKSFEDHYLNIPFDLSEVMFICTANVTDSIPDALLDRMEVIDIAGYTTEEKLQIAKRYLVPREKKENGLDKRSITLSDKALLHIVDGYTRESGVRELGRFISTVLRKVARLVAEGEKAPATITPKMVEKFLGPVRFVKENRLGADQVGVVTGLAWTSVGGETLTIEASLTKGKGSLSLTGQMGDVMRESAMAALTYVLSNATTLGFDPALYEQSNVHIHIPHGAIPKDGPSAGIAIASALVSLFTGKPISKNVAMTGEITLRGNVLPIGGLKEKALAALRVGIPILIMPQDNKRELVEFPKYLLDKVTFVPVSTVDEVFKVALVTKQVKKSEKVVLRI